MKVLTSTRQMAVFQIVRDVVVDLPAIDLNEFKDHWASTGLRHGDCRIAIAEMVRQHLLTSHKSHSHTYLELTEAGLAEFHDSDDSLIRQVNDGLLLLRAKWRQNWLTLSKQHTRHRRLGDQTAQKMAALH